jgi:4'-phosphopantetheinyl transferase
MRRVLLAYLTASKPSEIQFVEVDRKKPRLMTLHSSIEFSSSHSGDRGIIVTGPSPLGVDIEALERPIGYLGIAKHSFADEEYADIRRVRGKARRIAFFNCWTGKEAYVKAIGVGLSKPLRSFAVQCAPDEPPGLRWDNETHAPRAEYRFLRYTDNEYVATVVLTNPTSVIEPAFHALSPSFLSALRPLGSATGPNWRPTP